MTSKIVTTIKKDGPFFRHDVGKTIDGNIQSLMEALAHEGETDVAAQLRAGERQRYPLSEGLHPSRVSGHVVGRVHSMTGGSWHRTAVISINNSGFSADQGKALMAASSWVESQVHAFRKTTGRLKATRVVNQAELAKGLD